MNKRKTTKVVTIFTIIIGIMTVLRLGFNFILPMYLSFKLNKDVNHASSIGIIGGADGPTSIFLASQPNSYLITSIFALLTIGGFVVLFFLKRSAK